MMILCQTSSPKAIDNWVQVAGAVTRRNCCRRTSSFSGDLPPVHLLWVKTEGTLRHVGICILDRSDSP